MSGFILSGKARHDLKEIAKYTYATWGEKQCDTYSAEIDSVMRKLASGILLGKNCDFHSGYKKYYVGKHAVFFRQISEDTILVVRILHQSMDAELHI